MLLGEGHRFVHRRVRWSAQERELIQAQVENVRHERAGFLGRVLRNQELEGEFLAETTEEQLRRQAAIGRREMGAVELFFEQFIGKPPGSGPAIQQREGDFAGVHRATLTQPHEELESWSDGVMGV